VNSHSKGMMHFAHMMHKELMWPLMTSRLRGNMSEAYLVTMSKHRSLEEVDPSYLGQFPVQWL